MAKRAQSLEAIKKKAIGLIDNRATDNDGMLIKRDKNVTVLDIFGDERKAAVAYYVSDLLAKGFNNQQIIEIVKEKYNLDWKMIHVNKVKALLHKLWRCEMAHSMGDQVAKEVATIDTQIRETWAAWEFSKKGIKHTKTRTEGSNSEAKEMAYNLTEVVVEEDTTPGDIKYMQHLNDLGKEKRRLLGLYAPEKKDDGPKTAVQFNIVGEGAGGEITNLMQDIMRGAPAAPAPKNIVVEDAKVVDEEDEENTSPDMDIDKLMEELLAE